MELYDDTQIIHTDDTQIIHTDNTQNYFVRRKRKSEKAMYNLEYKHFNAITVKMLGNGLLYISLLQEDGYRNYI